jgi:4-phosphopantoate--beta-alanine ligase
MTVPTSHPRYESLQAREALVDGVEEGYVAQQGLIAHGRGEAFDYLLGEETPPPAREQARAAAAALVTAEHAVVSVNGNVAALAPEGVAELRRALGCSVEVNLFHRTDERVTKIRRRLEQAGCSNVLGEDPQARIPGLDSKRAKVDEDGIHEADCVLVPLEDGDRTEALVDAGKTVVAVDLNPLSRTAKRASITVVDELSRALAEIREAGEALDPGEAEQLVADFDNDAARGRTLAFLRQRLGELADAL